MVSGTHPQSTGRRKRIPCFACRFYLFVKSILKGGDSIGVCAQDDGVGNVWTVTLE